MTKIANMLSDNLINNTTTSKILALNTRRAVLEKSIDGTTAQRHLDLAELQAAGKLALYNQVTHDLLMCEVYKFTHISTYSKLNQQGQAIDALLNAAEQFKLEYTQAQNGLGIITKDEACNNVLQKIQTILNTAHSDGYLFAGLDATTKPCPLELTTISNVDNFGNILNNYTNSSPNVKTIATAKNQSIVVGIDASHPAFAALIGAINKIKAANVKNPTTVMVDLARYQSDLQDAILKLEVLKSTNINNKAELDQAVVNNDETCKVATDILTSTTFSKPVDEIVSELLELTKSLKILALVQSLDYRDFQNLISSFR